MKIADGFGLKSSRVDNPEHLAQTLREVFKSKEPTFTEIVFKPEDKLIPPVPSWIKKAEKLGLPHIG
jgi:acetolactate synthase-1/2/3 large subunit